jgi:hypothetical protein
MPTTSAIAGPPRGLWPPATPATTAPVPLRVRDRPRADRATVHPTTNTALTGATYDVDGGRRVVAGA